MRTLGLKKTWLGIAMGLGLVGLLATDVAAQSSVGAPPTLIPVSGQFVTADGQPRTGSAVLVLALYEGKEDPAPRWVEFQTVTLDAQGRYDVRFGATREDGLPADLFAGAAGTRWIGVAIENEVEQPRVMLVSVPYAAKAVEAETLAGRSASDFMLASTFRDDLKTALQEEGVRTGGTGGSVGTAAVTANFIQKGDGLGTTTDSALFETAGNVGLGTTTPATLFHLRGGLNLPAFRLENTEGTGAAWQVTSASDGQLRFTEVGAAVRLVVNKTTGTVGIGTGAPQTLLHLRAGLNLPAFRLENAEPTGATWQVTSASDGQFRLTEVGAATRFVIDKTTGNVGIGGGAPTAKLHVIGTTTLGGNTTIGGNAIVNGTTTINGSTTITGDITVNGNIAAKYQDVAEWVDAAEPLEAGSLVVIDHAVTNRVTAATTSYATSVAGAVSPQPGLILGEGGPGRVLVAQSGRVKVKADARYGAIKPGDLLVSSPTRGHVMRSKPVKVAGQQVHRPGTLVGKALEALPSGQGEILVLLTLQ
jgi:hypothetical protein